MNDTQSEIERVVMRRVRLIRILWLVVSTGTLALLALVSALWGIGKEVWVARVFENAPAGFVGSLDFYLAAFLHTKTLVQALILATLASFFFLFREIIRFSADFFSAPSRT